MSSRRMTGADDIEKRWIGYKRSVLLKINIDFQSGAASHSPTIYLLTPILTDDQRRIPPWVTLMTLFLASTVDADFSVIAT